MAIELIAKIKPKNGGNFPMVDAEDVAMPDGSRLSNFNTNCIPLPETAEVGQLLKVSAVDENGRITAVEAISSTNNLVPVTAEEYADLVASGGADPAAMYVIVRNAM